MDMKTSFILLGVFIVLFLGSLYVFNQFTAIDQSFLAGETIAQGSKATGTHGSYEMTAFEGGVECDDPGYVYCGDDVCGESEAWCDNWRDGGGHCKSSDPDWCCYDSGYVICGNTETCGPNNAWCENFLNGDKSCNYIVGGDRCCNDGGYIYDYGYNVCCPPASPYTPDGKWCYTTPQSGSDNFFTRHSKCSVALEEKCSGQALTKCEASQAFIYDWKHYGFVTGKCGVQCVTNSECTAPVVSNMTFCVGRDIAINTTSTMCGSDHACKDSYNTETVSSCSITCQDRPNGAQCSDATVYKALAISGGVVILLAIGAYFYFRGKHRKKK